MLACVCELFFLGVIPYSESLSQGRRIPPNQEVWTLCITNSSHVAFDFHGCASNLQIHYNYSNIIIIQHRLDKKIYRVNT